MPFQSNSSQRESKNFDHKTGQDMAAKVSQEIVQLRQAEYDALVNDPVKAISIGDRINDLERYLHAYRTGQQLPDQEVIPKSRLASSQNTSSDSSATQGKTPQDIQQKRGDDAQKAAAAAAAARGKAIDSLRNSLINPGQ